MINWREIPFVRVLLFFIIGILLALGINIELPASELILFFILLIFSFKHFTGLSFKNRWQFGALIYLFFLTIGYHVGYEHQEVNHSSHFIHSVNDAPVVLAGTVAANPKKGSTVKVKLTTSHLADSMQVLKPVTGNISLTLELDSLSNALEYGDKILVKGNVKPLYQPQNPEAFDYRKYLRLENIYHSSYIPSGQLEFVKSNTGNYLMSMANNMQQLCLAKLKEHLPGEREFAVGSALILGYKQELSPELRDSYANTGAMHVLAVSGLHVGIIAMLLGYLLSFFKPMKTWQKLLLALIQIAGIWVFAFVTGASASVLRAATMFSFLVIGIKLERSNNIYNTLAVSAFILLFVNPMLILHPGFQLSYLAVLGIVFFQHRIYTMWYIENKVGDFMWKLSSVALAAQISTFPISVFYFHQFPLYFILSGLVVIPAAMVILPLGISVILLGQIPYLGTIAGTILYKAIWLMNALIFTIEQLPYGVYEGIWLSLTSTILLYVTILLFSMLLSSKNFKFLLASMSGLVIIVAMSTFKNYKNWQQKEFVIYHINKQSCVDFFDQKRSFTLKSKLLTPKSMNWAAANYRMSKGIKENNAHDFDVLELHENNLYYKNGFAQFYDKKLCFINNTLPDSIPDLLKPDIIVLRENCKVKISDIVEKISPEKIVADGSNKHWIVNKWAEEATRLQVPFVSTRDGAFIYTLK